jgi:hypothetical protein
MIEWFALALFIAIFIWSLRETFVDTEFKSGGAVGVATAVQRPPSDKNSPIYAVWKSKIDAQVPIGANDDDYIKAIQAFYDKVYNPSPVKPSTASIEVFLEGPDVKSLPIDTNALRMIIADGFHIQPTESAAAREERQVKFMPTKNLEPAGGRDEVYTRQEDEYEPADTREGGPLPEGYYAPLVQQVRPRRPGESNYATVGKTGTRFYDVCSETRKPGCEENVL